MQGTHLVSDLTARKYIISTEKPNLVKYLENVIFLEYAYNHLDVFLIDTYVRHTYTENNKNFNDLGKFEYHTIMYQGQIDIGP